MKLPLLSRTKRRGRIRKTLPWQPPESLSQTCFHRRRRESVIFLIWQFKIVFNASGKVQTWSCMNERLGVCFTRSYNLPPQCSFKVGVWWSNGWCAALGIGRSEFKPLAGAPRCVLGARPFTSQCLSSPRCKNGWLQIYCRE